MLVPSSVGVSLVFVLPLPAPLPIPRSRTSGRSTVRGICVRQLFEAHVAAAVHALVVRASKAAKAEEALCVGGVFHVCRLLDAAVQRPCDEAAPREDTKAEEAERGADADEDGPFW